MCVLHQLCYTDHEYKRCNLDIAHLGLTEHVHFQAFLSSQSCLGNFSDAHRFWECEKCQSYKSSWINVINMVKAICTNIRYNKQGQSDSTCSLMAYEVKERE